MSTYKGKYVEGAIDSMANALQMLGNEITVSWKELKKSENEEDEMFKAGLNIGPQSPITKKIERNKRRHNQTCNQYNTLVQIYRAQNELLESGLMDWDMDVHDLDWSAVEFGKLRQFRGLMRKETRDFYDEEI